jgi:outer membrane receptor for ferrienterochelin and colicins
MTNKIYTWLLFSVLALPALGQSNSVSGYVHDGQAPLLYVNVGLLNSSKGCMTDENGRFNLEGLPIGEHILVFSSVGFEVKQVHVKLSTTQASKAITVRLESSDNLLEEVVITGTLRPMSKSSSPVPVELYTAKFFSANPTPSLFEGLQNVNGVRPQLNCNVCNTGDIHINGLEGPYTMVLMDGMPIVSGLSTVYGLSGIPQSLIERVEIVKGPASTLYGSEALGGVINIITKDPKDHQAFNADVMLSSWQEINTDLSYSFKAGKKLKSIMGLNYFLYDRPFDKNQDGFTDITLQNRMSLFNKWLFQRRENRPFSLAFRYIWEDRWGGEMNWNPSFRGGNERYAESIFMNRWELMGSYGIPGVKDLTLSVSANGHQQDAAYGTTLFNGNQYIAFAQLTWAKEWAKRHELLAGTAYRYTYYNDDTFATGSYEQDQPSITHLPGIFVQDQWSLNEHWTVLTGMRWDVNSIHGNIFTPRTNLKWTSANRLNIIRWSIGNGYRVANVFTEDHAALTGAREVVFLEELKPERSWNSNLNLVKKWRCANGTFISLDASAWYTRFSQRIFPDYMTDPNKIIYANLHGHSVSQGLSLTTDIVWASGLDTQIGITAQDVYVEENAERFTPVLTEQYSVVWKISYSFPEALINIDYTGNLYGPMKLPLLGALDQRADHSPWWSIQNIKLSKKLVHGLEVYAGIKNILNFTPPANSIARSFDPFDQQVQFDSQGQVIASPENPQALSFDPSYVFAPNQGRRYYVGLAYSLTR